MLNSKNNFKIYQSSKALGELAIASEYTMVIDGEPDLMYLIKQFPVPLVNSEDTIEAAMVGGLKGYVPQALKFDFRGTIAFKEDMNGNVRKFIQRIQADTSVGVRPKFNATIYLGVPDDYKQKYRIIDAVLFGFDPIDADMENRGQLVILSGQIAYMYFPENQ